jgi:hypothetical protein
MLRRGGGESNQTLFPALSWGGGGGGNALVPNRTKNLMQKCGMFICQLSASQTSEYFLPELKAVALCM